MVFHNTNPFRAFCSMYLIYGRNFLSFTESRKFLHKDAIQLFCINFYFAVFHFDLGLEAFYLTGELVSLLRAIIWICYFANAGMPQSSLLSPTFFHVHINYHLLFTYDHNHSDADECIFHVSFQYTREPQILQLDLNRRSTPGSFSQD